MDHRTARAVREAAATCCGVQSRILEGYPIANGLRLRHERGGEGGGGEMA
jgi:hypothetical protein